MMKKKKTETGPVFLLLMLTVILTACGGSGLNNSDSEQDTTASTATETAVDSDGESTDEEQLAALMAQVADLSLRTDKTAIKTDNAEQARLTATVVDHANSVLAGVPVEFKASSGNLSASSVTTDENGQAQVTLKSGASDFSNRTAMVTVNVNTLSTAVPVLIHGSELQLQTSQTSLQVERATARITATARDAGGIGQNAQRIRFSFADDSTASASLSATEVQTGVQGETPEVILTPLTAGTLTLQAQWLNPDDSVSVMVTETFDIAAAAGIPFEVVTPAADLTTMVTGSQQSFQITVPDRLSESPVQQLRASATSGGWALQSPEADSPQVMIVDINDNQADLVYRAGENSGIVTLQFDALDENGEVLGTISSTAAVSAPVANAFSINLQSSVTTLSPSSGDNSSTATVTAVVRDELRNTISQAPVKFELLATTGSGERLAPSLVYTNEQGVAQTTFTAGSTATTGPVYIRASLAGENCSGDPVAGVTENNRLCNTLPIRVAATAVSVIVGFGTTVNDSADFSQYSLPGSVLVVDGNGSAVQNALVTLSAFPVRYRNGRITSSDDGCVAPNTPFVPSEDQNRNGVLDPGEDALMPLNGILDPGEDRNNNGQLDPSEDTNFNGVLDLSEDVNGNGVLDPSEDLNGNGQLDRSEDLNLNGQLDPGEDVNENGQLDLSEDRNGNGVLDPSEDRNGNGVLDLSEDINNNGVLDGAEDTRQPANGIISPPQAAGGALPATVTTDDNGSATFALRYPKDSAYFIQTEVKASVMVSGSERSTATRIYLPASAADATSDPCVLARSADY